MLREAKQKLKEAEAVNEKLKKKKNTPKGVLIIAEGDVARAERAFKRAAGDDRRFKKNVKKCAGLAAREAQCSGLFLGVSRKRKIGSGTKFGTDRVIDVANLMEVRSKVAQGTQMGRMQTRRKCRRESKTHWHLSAHNSNTVVSWWHLGNPTPSTPTNRDMAACRMDKTRKPMETEIDR